MDVLNTTGGGIDSSVIIIGVFAGTLATLSGCLTYDCIKERYWFFACVTTVITLFLTLVACAAFTVETPTRHEVTLRPGYVIDAEKYEIVEQRGKIYVIEEREAVE